MSIRSGILLAAAAAGALAAGATAAAAQSAAARSGGPRDARTLLGVAVGLSASDRDTLGVLVAGVAPGGPAEQAGIVQGSRIAVVEGVSVRVDPEDVGRQESGEAVLRRLARALQGVEPGSEVSLRVFADGRYQIVKVQTVAPRPPEPAAEELAWAATGEAVTAAPTRRSAVAPSAATAAAGPVSVTGIMDALANIQTQVHRLSQDQESGPLLDTLEALDQELGALRRRLRAAQSPAAVAPTATPRRVTPSAAAVEQSASVVGSAAATTAARATPASTAATATTAAAAASTPAPAAPSGGGGSALPGLNVTTVGAELVSYFGEGSERGLLVLQADSSWAPIKTGDIILSVNGAPVTAQRLRVTLTSRRQSAIELLRRKRPLTVALPPRG